MFDWTHINNQYLLAVIREHVEQPCRTALLYLQGANFVIIFFLHHLFILIQLTDINISYLLHPIDKTGIQIFNWVSHLIQILFLSVRLKWIIIINFDWSLFDGGTLYFKCSLMHQCWVLH